MSYNSNEICKKNQRKARFVFINGLIQLYCLVHVSNNQVFILRKTCTCSFMVLYEGRTESHEQFFFACELGTAEEGEYDGRWNQLLCYPLVCCDVNSLHQVTSITPNKMADLNEL